MKITRLTHAEFKKLDEYSCSIPTGTTYGVQWKRNENAYAIGARCGGCRREFRAGSRISKGTKYPNCKEEKLTWFKLAAEWKMAEYYDLGPPRNEKHTGIRWSKIEIIPECPDHPKAEPLKQRRKGPDHGKWFCPQCGLILETAP